MPETELVVSSSPHVRSSDSTQAIMKGVILALIPAVGASVYFCGYRALLLIVLCSLTSVVTEAICQRLRGREVTVHDGSALVTGLLLALTLPPGLAPQLAVIGAVVAIALGKQAFGGLGHNPFNPALIGRAFLMISFPVRLTRWPEWSLSDVDLVTTATPLQLIAEEGIAVGYGSLFWGQVSGSLGETSALALLLGAGYLLHRKLIDWRIPTGIWGSMVILTLVSGRDPLFHLLAGGLMLGSLYMATDMVTSPLTVRGRWLFGILTGVLIFLIRFYGGYPEGVMFAILLMNMAVPLIDSYTQPRIYGEVREHA